MKAHVLSLAAGQALLGLAALDTSAAVAVALRPGLLLSFLGADLSPDSLLTMRALAAITTLYAGFLALATLRPARFAGLVAAPAAGRLLQMVLWGGLLGTTRVSLPPGPLYALLAQDALVLTLLGAGWLLVRPRSSGSVP